MGRHSAAYIAGTQRIYTPTASRAGYYVGRIGALAFALGVGAAVAGGAGAAHAEGPTDSGSATAPPSPGTSTGLSGAPGTPTGSDASTAKSVTSTTAPGTTLGNGRHATTGTQSTSPRRGGSTTATPNRRSTATERTRPKSAVTTADDRTTPISGLASNTTVTQTDSTDLRPTAAVPSTRSTRDDTPATPFPIVQAALQSIHREIERAFGLGPTGSSATPVPIPSTASPSVSTSTPTPADQAVTPYGAIGKWMLQPNGQISNYGGLPSGGKTVLEPVNVIIVDPSSSSATESARRLNTAMFWSGFPAQPIHSTGFQGRIDDVTYGQEPTGPLLGYSDDFFLLTNNHGRIFGPDPVETSTGYVWSGAFSTEAFVFYQFLPRHAYVSSTIARNALAMSLIASGRATYGGMVPLENAYTTADTTTGDHDGYAVVVILR